jgi:mannose-6-phosphate isomerase-like protein (cupin superfamily)
MAEDTFDLLKNYFLLEPDGAAIVLTGGMDFWSQLMSGDPTDPGIRRLMGSERGRLLTVLTMNADWTNWEMHPVGDELLFMLEGSATFLLDRLDGVREVPLNAGRLLVIPRGVWHTAKLSGPARLLAITPGHSTQHKPA